MLSRLSEMFDPRGARRYAGRHRAARPAATRYVGTVVIRPDQTGRAARPEA